MNNDTKQASDNQPSGGLGLPPLPQAPILVDVTASPPPPPASSPTPEPVVPSPLPTLPDQPLAEMAPSTGLPTLEPIAPPTPPIEEKPKEEGVKPVKSKRKINKKVVIGGVVALFVLVGAVAVSYLFPGFRGDIRQRASYSLFPYCSRAMDDCAWGCNPSTSGGSCKSAPVNCPNPKTCPDGTVIDQCRQSCPTAAPVSYCSRAMDDCAWGCNPSTSGGSCKPAPATPTAPPIGGICPEGQTKCVSNVHYVCDEGKWGAEGSCGITATPTPTTTTREGGLCSPEGKSSCSGGVKYVCSGSKWQDAGNCPIAVSPTPTLRLTPTSIAGCPEGQIKCEGGWYWVCDENSWNVEGTCGTPTPTQVVGGTGGPTTAPGDREGVWGEFGVDCDRSTGICTGDQINVYSCDPTQTQTGPVKPDGSGGGPICLQGLQTTSGSVNCVDIANQTCSFVQLDVVTSNPLSGSAMTCYPTIDCTAPVAPSPTTALPPPQTTPGDNPAETTTTTTTTATATPSEVAPACVNTRIFINGSTTVATAAEMNAIKIGDTLRMVVQGNNTSLAGARFIVKIDGADVSNGGFEVTNTLSPIQASGVREFYYDYPISQGGAYTIEGYVNSVPPAVTATPVPTVIPTATATPAPIVEGGVYGNGADGACTATGSVNLSTGSCASRSTPDAIAYRTTFDVSAGTSNITLASAPTGITTGDEVLIINLQGPGSGVGDYETMYVTGVVGSRLDLNKALTKSFSGSTNKIMVQRVPHYTTANVGGTLTAGGYSCSSFLGGVLFFRASGAVNVASGGAIDMGGKGFSGGGSIDQNGGIQGVSQVGCGTNVAAANGGGGGGGRSNAWDVDPGNGAGGGGGGYGAAGGAGAGSSGGNQGGAAGITYGVADLTTKLFPGSGGGGGGNEMNGPSGNGGNGGGVVAIFADTITVAGQVNSNGTNATAAFNTAGGGGGGAGGSVLLYGKSLVLGANLTKATGGTGSAGPKGGQGGNGGGGRISIRYSTGSTGTTTPAANSAQLTMLDNWLLNKLAWVNIIDRQ